MWVYMNLIGNSKKTTWTNKDSKTCKDTNPSVPFLQDYHTQRICFWLGLLAFWCTINFIYYKWDITTLVRYTKYKSTIIDNNSLIHKFLCDWHNLIYNVTLNQKYERHHHSI